MIGKKAILMIHGFAGGTYDLEYLQNELGLIFNFDVFSYTLPGHDGFLTKVSYKEWLDKSEEMVKWLIDNGYRNIYLVSHSMGGVISCFLATKYKEIQKLVLLSPAFNYLEAVGDDVNFTKSLKKSTQLLKDYNRQTIFSRAFKFNPHATKEFIKLVQENYKTPKDVKCPALIIHGNKDNLAPLSSAYYVYDNIQTDVKQLVIVDGATHDILKNDKKEQIRNIVEKFLKTPTKGKYNI